MVWHNLLVVGVGGPPGKDQIETRQKGKAQEPGIV